MTYQEILEGIKRFNSTDKDACLYSLGVAGEKIKENVILAPWWQPSAMDNLGQVELLSPPHYILPKVWNIKKDNLEMTYITTGIGAPMLLEPLLALGLTACKHIIFVGSVGSLDKNIGIGDFVLPSYSVCGDGASRYIASNNLKDVFGERVYPGQKFSALAKSVVEKICNQHHVKYHEGRIFSIDTIFAQFAHIDKIIDSGCNVIEMETAVAFRAAALMNIDITALLSVSDNTIANKSLLSGRTQQEDEYRRFVRREIFPKIIHSIFCGI